ncbi:MAG TPA: glycosyltransferase family 2 protein [Candidatus Saccharimonadales bacterium]|nr:glycosyltransferase family 2 protein [Candidatus Saccharimonadales bacterium]
MKNKSLVSIVNWNNSAATNACLFGIAQLPKEEQPDVVVVDNHSLVDPLKLDAAVKNKLRSLKVIENSDNLGFAGGHNPNIKAAKESGYAYVFVLNPDTEIIDKEVFKELVAGLEANKSALAAAPTILSSNKPAVIWYGGGQLSTKTSVVKHLGVGKIASAQPGSAKTVSFITGCCFAIALKRADLKQLLFQDEYFLYWEDADWCARALGAGFELLYLPNVKILHHVSSSLGVRSPAYIYYNIRNHFLFIRDRVGGLYKFVAFLRLLYISLKYVINIWLRYSQKHQAAKGLFWGWADGLRGKSGKLKRRL